MSDEAQRQSQTPAWPGVDVEKKEPPVPPHFEMRSLWPWRLPFAFFFLAQSGAQENRRGPRSQDRKSVRASRCQAPLAGLVAPCPALVQMQVRQKEEW